MGPKWSPLNCCCVFYTANAGTKILIHMEIALIIIGYIMAFVALVAGQAAVVETLDILFDENIVVKIGFAVKTGNENIHKEIYQLFRETLFISVPFASLLFVLVLIPALLALKKRKPNWLIPFVIYKILLAFGSVAVVAYAYTNVMYYHDQLYVGQPSSDKDFFERLIDAFFPTGRTEKHLRVQLGKALYAGFILSVIMTIFNFHLAIVVVTGYRNLIEATKKGRDVKASSSSFTKKFKPVEEYVMDTP